MKFFISFCCIISAIACNQVTPPIDNVASAKQVEAMLDSLNVAAARADFNAYFSYYAADAVFMGTDATERWNKSEFMEWSKPYFDNGKAWSFQSVKRTISFDSTGTLAWFDELLSTQMKICRGSGIAVRQKNEWKLKQYVLSMTIPNAFVDTVVSLKSAQEDSILTTLRK